MNTHLKTAHQHGVNKALKEAGYSSIEEINKEAADLGLVDAPKEEDKVASVLANLGAKLG